MYIVRFQNKHFIGMLKNFAGNVPKNSNMMETGGYNDEGLGNNEDLSKNEGTD